MVKSQTIAIIGYGRLGSVLHQAWSEANDFAFAIVAPRAPILTDANVTYYEAESDEPIHADVVVFCLKPQVLEQTLPKYQKRIAQNALVVSTAAGKSLAFYRSYFPTQALIRSMPNTLARVGQAFTGLLANGHVTSAQKELLEGLFLRVGKVAWLEDDEQMDRLTALAGSGPAYMYYWAECIYEAARKMGFSEQASQDMARSLLIGVAQTLEEGASWEVLRQEVTSKGGTTEAALHVLMAADNGLQPLINRAVDAAHLRARELAKA